MIGEQQATDETTAVLHVQHDGHDAFVLRNDQVAVTVLPGLGSKVVSLVDQAGGREWLTSAERGWPNLADYDDPWDRYDKSGWDECVPSVAPGSYSRAPWIGVPIRDHGELWQRPWAIDVTSNAILTRIHGLRFPYVFERKLSLNGRLLTASYTMRNLVEIPFWYVWSMHPLLVLEPRTWLRLPAGIKMSIEALFTDCADPPVETEFTWPAVRLGQVGEPNGQTRNMAELRHDDLALGIKMFTERSSVARAAVQAPDQSWLGISLDPKAIPFLGIWINEGRWPIGGEGLYHVALEPTNANRDSLDVALAAGSGTELAGGAADHWQVHLRIGQATESLETFLDSEPMTTPDTKDLA